MDQKERRVKLEQKDKLGLLDRMGKMVTMESLV